MVSYHCDDAIAAITIDDGKVNALSLAVLAELDAALDQAERDGAVVILAGRDGVFSAGFDLPVLRAGGPDALAMLRAVVLAETFTPADAVAAGFLDRTAEAGGVHEAARGAAARLAALDRSAHEATKRRARGQALSAIRSAIDADMAEYPVQAPAS